MTIAKVSIMLLNRFKQVRIKKQVQQNIYSGSSCIRSAKKFFIQPKKKKCLVVYLNKWCGPKPSQYSLIHLYSLIHFRIQNFHEKNFGEKEKKK